MATHSSTLAWRIPIREEPGRLQSMGLQRVGHDWATSLHFILNDLRLTRQSFGWITYMSLTYLKVNALWSCKPKLNIFARRLYWILHSPECKFSVLSISYHLPPKPRLPGLKNCAPKWKLQLSTSLRIRR